MFLRNGWNNRQKQLKEWRASIWENEGNSLEQKIYIDWHLEFFEGFYAPPNDRNAKLLDVGCSYMFRHFEQSGRTDQLLELLGCYYIGIDPIDDWFPPPGKYNAEFHKGVGENIQFANEIFDRVMILGTLDHCMKPKKVLKEIYRVLKPGGSLWFANSFVEGLFFRVLNKKIAHRIGRDPHHLFVWEPKDLEKLIRKTGFTIVKTDRCQTTTSYFIEGAK